MRRLRTALAALATAAVALMLVTTAGADDVSSAPASVTITAGGAAATIDVSIAATDDDGQVGCNVNSQSTATVTFTAAAPVVVTPALNFQNCHQTKQVTVSAPAGAAPGDYTIAVAASGGVGGSFTVSPSSIAVHVDAAAPTQDTTPPTLSLPGNLTAEATSAAGAVVTYTASATDNAGAATVTCTPPSGSTFPLGQTTVNCTATDTASNSTTGSFVVTVQDTTGPVITVPGGISVEATGSSGATVTYDASATDAVDGTRPVTCSPASGSTFAVGSTNVSCTSADSRGNQSSASFAVQVGNAAPTLVVPPTQTVEATGPNGASVTYVPQPSASDTVDGALTPSCTRPSGAVFPLGRTTVTCTATDSSGASASASFDVVVVDTTPPVVTVPPPWTFVGDSSGLSRSDPSLALYLSRGRADDLVDPAPLLAIEAPAVLPLGTTQVRYVAVDSAGNVASDSTFITVVPPPPPGQPRPPAPPAVDPPPGNVSALRARPGNALVRLSWTAPRDDDVVRYAAFRSERTGPVVQVYSGAARSFVDRGLSNGVEYRYVVVAYDRAGNRSVGVAVLARPRLPMLLAPRDGARLARGTTFSWRRVTGARYYNFQLFRAAGGGRLVKILSTWPVTNRFQLGATWRFGGRRHRLTPGTYRWFVWPGFGARADARYGDLLGERTFTITRRRR